jgi:hypothetical protein
MRRLAALALLLATGCGTHVVLRIPDFPSLASEPAPAAAPPPNCRYLNVLVDYSTEASGLALRDVSLSAHVAEVMKKELTRLGVHVTQDPNEAYWSLMLIAVHNQRDGGFIFSAMLHLRDLSEARNPGIATYSRPTKATKATKVPVSLPSMYTGVSYGSQQDVERLAREYVHKAEEALLPSARQLCEFETLEARQSNAVDDEVAHPEAPL